jgi:hypothetical protein
VEKPIPHEQQPCCYTPAALGPAKDLLDFPWRYLECWREAIRLNNGREINTGIMGMQLKKTKKCERV